LNSKLILVGLVISMLCIELSGCEEKGDTYSDSNDSKQMILGSWQWIETIQRINGNTTSFNETNHTMIYRFYKNGTVEIDDDISDYYNPFYSRWLEYRIENNKLIISSSFDIQLPNSYISFSDNGEYLLLTYYATHPEGKSMKITGRYVKLV